MGGFLYICIMDYKLIHDKIIQKAISESRKRGDGIYYEEHHILPKCMGGKDMKTNLVLLTAREHFVIHKLLPTIYPEYRKELSLALHRMSFSTTSKMKRNYRIGSREFERIRKEIGEAISGKNNPFSGKKHTEESKKLTGDKAKERLSNPENHPLFGVPCSDDRKEKIRVANTGKKHSDDARAKMSKTRKGKPKSREHVINQANAIRGKKRSEETKNKLRVPKPKFTCIHCGQIIGGQSNLQQHINKKHITT